MKELGKQWMVEVQIMCHILFHNDRLHNDNIVYQTFMYPNKHACMTFN